MPLSLKLGNIIIPYEERKSIRIKRISIRSTAEKVRVSAPARASKRDIQAFIDKNRDWILENWLKIQENVVRPARKYYQTGVVIPFLGKDIELRIREIRQKMISARYLKEECALEVSLPQGLGEEQKQEVIREILEKWLKSKARSIFIQKLDSWSGLMGVNYNQFRLKEQKTRWGSCSSLGNINLNWRAVMAPELVVDYLVIHELAHLKYMNHSQEFWEYVAGFAPQHRTCRKWLRDNGNTLVI